MGKYKIKNFDIQKLIGTLTRLSKSYQKCDINFDTEEGSIRFDPIINDSKRLGDIQPDQRIGNMDSEIEPPKKNRFDLGDLSEIA